MQDVTKIPNWIQGQQVAAQNGDWVSKINPHTGQVMSQFAASDFADVDAAISAAKAAAPAWADLTPVRRGQILAAIVAEMKSRAQELADCIAEETGKPPQDAAGETGGAIMQGEFFAGEGMRLYARSLTSGMPCKYSHLVRMPLGIAGLIVPANTPIANIAWKAFPALICGNTVVMKAADDSPRIALLFAEITKAAGLPDGVLNVIQGTGQSAGVPLVNDPRIDVISFTGSTAVGRQIAAEAGRRLARVSLELGGKNPFVVCADADLEQAVHWASLSAFSNAGQRCAAASRFLVAEEIYDAFRDALVAKAKGLKLGVSAGCDLGPVITERQYNTIMAALKAAEEQGGRILCGGQSPTDSELVNGYYIEPTVVEGLSPSADLSQKELFGPVVALHKVKDLSEALELANDTDYGLTAAIHTQNVDQAHWFAQRIRAGVVNINIGSYGSEPHMPFGGFGASGNGTREPGVEALDVYSELKNISVLVRSDLV